MRHRRRELGVRSSFLVFLGNQEAPYSVSEERLLPASTVTLNVSLTMRGDTLSPAAERADPIAHGLVELGS